MTDEAYEQREAEMAWEAKALIAICDNAHTRQIGDGTVYDPPLVTVSDAARVVGRLVGAVVRKIEAERDAAVATLTRLVELKDGPRDSTYYSSKARAWDRARAIVGVADTTEDEK